MVRVPIVGMVLVSCVLLAVGLQQIDTRHRTAIAHVRATRLVAVAQHDALIRELERAYAEVDAKIHVLPTAPDVDAADRALAQRRLLLVERAHMELVVPATPDAP